MDICIIGREVLAETAGKLMLVHGTVCRSNALFLDMFVCTLYLIDRRVVRKYDTIGDSTLANSFPRNVDTLTYSFGPALDIAFLNKTRRPQIHCRCPDLQLSFYCCEGDHQDDEGTPVNAALLI